MVAGPLEAAESFSHLSKVDVGASGEMERLAGWCAGIKFLLVFSSLGYLVLQRAAVLASKMRVGQ